MRGNGIREATTTAGPGAITLVGVTGYPRFSAAYAAGADQLIPYTITDSDAAPIEGGLGYLSDINTLMRAAPIWTFVGGVYADNAPAAVDLQAGTKYVHCSAPWQTLRSAPGFGCQFAHPTGAMRAIFNSLSTTTGTSANSWTSANRMHFWPILLDEGAVVSGIVVSGVTNSGGHGFACGIYSVRSDGRPGMCLASTGKVIPVGGSASQVISFTGGNLPAMPGLYYLGAIVTNSSLTFDLERNRPHLLGSGRGMAAPCQGFTENIADGWGDVPSSAVAAVIYNYNDGYQSHPCVGLRVAS